MNLRKTLAAYFLPTRRLIGNEGATVQQGGALGGNQWVVPRSSCQYRRLDMSTVPARQRDAAARLAMSRHLPSPQALAHVGWHRGIAHLWIWSDARAEIAEVGQSWLPETLLMSPPSEDGARLLQMASGVEGQVWKGGDLVASQWWPESPQSDAWARFVRSAGLEHADGVPAAQRLPWLAVPWGESARRWSFGSPAARERFAWVAAAAMVAAVFGWQLAEMARWGGASTELAASVEATRLEVAPMLEARERAERLQDASLKLRELQVGLSDYTLMAQVIAALPEGVRLETWRREPGKIETAVSGGGADPRAFVSAFAGMPVLGEVSATPAGARMQLVFTLPAQPGQGGQ